MRPRPVPYPILGLLALVLIVPLRPAASQSAATAVISEPTLRPGDAVRIMVWRQVDLSGEFTIRGDGTLSHPLYRDVQVVGLPLADIEAHVRTFLLQFEANPRFVVEPLFRVAVGGEVGRPNLYYLRPGTSLAEAIALAGGPTERGRWDVRLLRNTRELHYNLKNPSGQANPLIASGDQILVERRHATFRDYLAPIILLGSATAAIVTAANR